ncbi:MAG: hypothetical protein HRT88_21680, partial [Lentisphaeraceae bacterium]|nr:hypothetical protein [Lentisphaeraceae bacterium]
KINSDLVKSVSSALSSRGSIDILGKRSLLVKDTTGAIERVRRILKSIDRAIPQVQIEVRFFEVNVSKSEEIGLNWKDLLLTDGIEATTIGYILKDGALSSGVNPGFTSTGPIDGAVLAFGAKDLIFKALNSSSTVSQLSNPKIVVASGEQAVVHIGDQIPIVQEKATIDDQGQVTLTIELDSGFGAKTDKAINLMENKEHIAPQAANHKGYLDIGTILTVAPSVKSDEDVYIKIIPQLLTADFNASEAFTKQSLGGNIRYPKLSQTTVYTEFMLKSGQTAAIGGLVKTDVTEAEEKVPFLGDIPYLGSLFRHKVKIETKKEVLIFVTVKIINTKNLDVTAGVPVKATHAQQKINDIRKNDALGAEYIEYKVIEEVDNRRKINDLLPDISKALKEYTAEESDTEKAAE